MSERAAKLVCVGGTLCDDRLFEPLRLLLKREMEIWNPVNHSSVTDAAAALLQSVSDDFVIVGFSLGGFVALEVLRQSPDRVLAVILLSGNAFPDAPGNARMRRQDVALGKSVGLAQLLSSRADRLVPPAHANSKALVNIIADMAETLGDEVHARQAEMNSTRPDFRDLVSQATCPILAVAGSDDQICPADRYADLQKTASVCVEMIPHTGHYLPLEVPERCAELIETFLERHRL